MDKTVTFLEMPLATVIDTDSNIHDPKMLTLNLEPSPLYQLKQRKNPLVNIIQIYFNFAYYLSVSPFRIVMDRETGKFSVKTFRLQQMFCGISQIMCMIKLITDFRYAMQYVSDEGKKNPLPNYFGIILTIATVQYKFVTMKRFWLQRKDYLRIINFIQEASFLHDEDTNSKLLRTPFLCGFFGLCTAQAIANLIVGKNFAAEANLWTPSFWLSELVKLTRYTFFLSDRLFDMNDTCMLVDITGWDIAVASVFFLGIIQRFLLSFFGDLCILSCAATLWVSAKSFSNYVAANELIIRTVDYGEIPQTERNSNWSKVYTYFKTIQVLSRQINKALGSQVTCFMAEALLYYSMHIAVIFTSTDLFTRFEKFLYHVILLSIFFFSADICYQMESVKMWICHGENRKTVPDDQLNIVLHEMLVKDIGVRGSNTFTLTYPLLAMFLSTIVTYFIIYVQDGSDPMGDRYDNDIRSENYNCSI